MSDIVNVPDNAFLNCPENNFLLTRVKLCASCQFYNGLNKAGESGQFENDFQVICSRPLTRRITKVDI